MENLEERLGVTTDGAEMSSREFGQRLRFEKLVADLSAEFVNMPTGEVDDAVEAAQRRVCECLGLEMSVLWQWTPETPSFLTVTHLHTPPYGPAKPDRLDAKEAFPWVLAQLMAGRDEPLVIERENLPPEAARDRDSLLFYGVHSTAVYPLSTGCEPLIGILSFESLKPGHKWSESVLRRLRVIAQVFSNTLSRKESELALRMSEERMSLAAESAGAGLWELDCQSGNLWVTPRTREILGFSPEEPVNLARFEASVESEDLPLVTATIDRAVQTGDPVSAEFRIRHTDGTFRWVSSKGRLNFAFPGKRKRLLGVLVDITEPKRAEADLHASLDEIKRLKQHIETERDYLKAEIRGVAGHVKIVGKSTAIKETLLMARKVATADSPVLITGETGTGKELIAKEIHDLSTRRQRLMVKVNCAALPTALIESELFGREKGAFTGALTKQIGRFELADRSTIFLDEVGELPLDLQAKLLRVLQEGEFERLGSPRTIKVNVRVIAASNRDLKEEVRRGRFREDLFFRLNVFPLRVPPLRERREDIPLLTWSFLSEFSTQMGKAFTKISRATMEALQQNDWPGNVRELRNVLERAAILSTGDTLKLQEITESSVADPPVTLSECEHRHILATLERTRWRIKGPKGAAALLGINPSTLYSRMEKLGIPTAREQHAE